MLNPYNQSIDEVAFVYAHTGLKEDCGNRIYEVAATIFARNQSRRDFSTLVRYGGLTERERTHSNISRESLRDAPEAVVAASRLNAFLEGQPFILVLDPHHGLDEIVSLIGKVRTVDLSFAAEFFLPHVESFSPGGLWEYLNGKKREKVSFSASEMVDLSVDLVRHICSVRLNEEGNPPSAALRYYLKKSETLLGEVFNHLTNGFQDYWGGLFTPATGLNTANWMQFLEKAPSVFQFPQEGQGKIKEQRLRNLFQGFAESGKGFSFRETQFSYARHISEALNDGAVLTLEAGTGTGKTQGYLIPCMEYLRLNPDARVMISTYTKSLQDQIYFQEIHRTVALERDYREIAVALLKGKSNYLCAEKLNQAFEEELKGARLLAWLYFVNLVFLFRQVDGETVGEKVGFYLNDSPYFRLLRNEISAKTGCSGNHVCCPAQVAIAEARSARLVITNHYKMALIDLDEELSGLFRNCIIDEANHFEQAVRNAFSLSVNSREILDVLTFLETMLQKVSRKISGEAEKVLQECMETIAEFQSAVQEFGDLLRTIHPGSSTGEILELPACHDAYPEEEIGKVLHLFAGLLKNVTRGMSFLKDPDTSRVLKILPQSQERIRNALARLFSEAENLLLMAKTIHTDNYVAACQLYPKNWVILASAMDVSALIKSHVYDKRDCVVYTSATLRHRKSFEDFCSMVGIECSKEDRDHAASGMDGTVVAPDHEERDFRFAAIASPFSRESLKIVLPDRAVSGAFMNKNGWLENVVSMLPELIRKNRGRTLILFSSYSDLEMVAARTEEEIMGDGYPLLIQQVGRPTGNLIDEFRTIKESVLFGVDTFWYGVDFRGDTLTQVIITRIPFPYLFDPLQIARKKALSEKEFWNRYYYEAMIKLKQGIGRLIRSETDKGRVILLDSRCRNFDELWN